MSQKSMVVFVLYKFSELNKNIFFFIFATMYYKIVHMYVIKCRLLAPICKAIFVCIVLYKNSVPVGNVYLHRLCKIQVYEKKIIFAFACYQSAILSLGEKKKFPCGSGCAGMHFFIIENEGTTKGIGGLLSYQVVDIIEIFSLLAYQSISFVTFCSF